MLLVLGVEVGGVDVGAVVDDDLVGLVFVLGVEVGVVVDDDPVPELTAFAPSSLLSCLCCNFTPF